MEIISKRLLLTTILPCEEDDGRQTSHAVAQWAECHSNDTLFYSARATTSCDFAWLSPH